MAEQKFDVFLCYNTEDRAAVIAIAQQLQQNGLKPWMDILELQPGSIWQICARATARVYWRSHPIYG